MKRLFLLLLATVSLNAADAKKDDIKKDDKMHTKNRNALIALREKNQKILEVLRFQVGASNASFATHPDEYGKLIKMPSDAFSKLYAQFLVAKNS